MNTRRSFILLSNIIQRTNRSNFRINLLLGSLSQLIFTSSILFSTTKVSYSMTSLSASSGSSSNGSTGTTTTTFYRHLPFQVKRLSEHATLPVRGSEYAAGLDLASAVDITIPAGQRALVPTDLAIACPPGTYGRIAPRSGLAYKHGIDVGAGVIDADYRGPLGVILFNFDPSNEFVVKRGDRIAQLIFEQIILPDVVECTELPAVGIRGSAGFGSTGISNTVPIDSSNDNDEANKKQRTISPQPSNDEVC